MECNDLNAGQNIEADTVQNCANSGQAAGQPNDIRILDCEDEDDDDEELTELLQQQQQDLAEQQCPPPAELEPEQPCRSSGLPEVTTIDGNALLRLPMVRVDFEKLIPDSQTGVDIPLCIAGPLFGMLEALRCELKSRGTKPFFERMEELKSDDKYERLDREVITWLYHSCRLYSESRFLFQETDSLYAFHVSTRIINMIKPKLFPISKFLARQAEQTNLYCAKMPFLETRRFASNVVEHCDDGSTMPLEDLLSPERTEVALSTINNFIAMIVFDLYHIERRENRDIVRFIFLIFIQAFREYIERINPDSSIPRDSLYSLHTVQKSSHIYKPMLGTVSLCLGKGLIGVPIFWIADIFTRHFGLESIDIEANCYRNRLVKRIVENVLTIGSPTAFLKGNELVLKTMVDGWMHLKAEHLSQVQKLNSNLTEETYPHSLDTQSQASRAALFKKPPIPTIGGHCADRLKHYSPNRSFATTPETVTEGNPSFEASQCPPNFRPTPSVHANQCLYGVRSQECSPSRCPVSQIEYHSELSSPFKRLHFPPGFYTSSTSSIDPTETNVRNSLPPRGPPNPMRAQSEGRVPLKPQYIPGFSDSLPPPLKPASGCMKNSATTWGSHYLTGMRSQVYQPSNCSLTQTTCQFGGPQYPPAFRTNPSSPNLQGYFSPRGQSGLRSQGNRAEVALPLNKPQYAPDSCTPSIPLMRPTVVNKKLLLPSLGVCDQMRAQFEAHPLISQKSLSKLGDPPTVPIKTTEASNQGHFSLMDFKSPTAPSYQFHGTYAGFQNVNAAGGSDCSPSDDSPNTTGVKISELPSLRSPCPLIQAGQSDSCERPHQRFGVPVFLDDLEVKTSCEMESDEIAAFKCPSSNQPSIENGITDQPCPPTICLQFGTATTQTKVSQPSSSSHGISVSPCARSCPQSLGAQDVNVSPGASSRQGVHSCPCPQNFTRKDDGPEVNIFQCIPPSTRSSGLQEENALQCTQPSTQSSGLQAPNGSPCAQPSTR
ncbi:unnamed protein product, partial [Hydatigera taeniaeformis]|uniref:Cyclin N-terminal domain-containing protein n=1 Tax=Hydatigena taeniaeformis TaxID=6205 RepID=A0A0R3X4D6_HYDTA